MSAVAGDYARAQRLGHVVGELLVETMGGIGPALLEVLQGAAESRANKLTHGEFEMEATWSTRKYMPFVMQRISIAVQMAAALEDNYATLAAHEQQQQLQQHLPAVLFQRTLQPHKQGIVKDHPSLVSPIARNEFAGTS